jgi:hypothetical protein
MGCYTKAMRLSQPRHIRILAYEYRLLRYLAARSGEVIRIAIECFIDELRKNPEIARQLDAVIHE